jgi:hypothetical protein
MTTGTHSAATMTPVMGMAAGHRFASHQHDPVVLAKALLPYCIVTMSALRAHVPMMLA